MASYNEGCFAWTLIKFIGPRYWNSLSGWNTASVPAIAELGPLAGTWLRFARFIPTR